MLNIITHFALFTPIPGRDVRYDSTSASDLVASGFRVTCPKSSLSFAAIPNMCLAF